MQPQDEWAPRLWPGEEPLPLTVTIQKQQERFFVSMLNKPLEDVACYCPGWRIFGHTLLDSAMCPPWEQSHHGHNGQCSIGHETLNAEKDVIRLVGSSGLEQVCTEKPLVIHDGLP